MTDLAEFGRLPLDALLGAEPTRSYKPMEEAYLGTARLLGCRPGQCMLVAAHNQDLHAASALGFRTAFVHRPREYGPDQATDLAPDARWDVVADGLDDLAEQLLGGH
jgi:2-haloacid dehalogenase